MFHEVVKHIEYNLKPGRVMEHVNNISLHHRAQVSPGYHDAAAYCQNALLKAGVECRILEYPANNSTWYFEDKGFREWRCNSAFLELVVPHKEVLCNYDNESMCVLIRSYTADFMDKGLEIVHLPKGSTVENCTKDIRGKIILLDEPQFAYIDWACEQMGAVGILTDYLPEYNGVRSRYELAECITYKSFAAVNEVTAKAFGFSISPKLGDKLRALCAEMEKENDADPAKPRYPRVKGNIHTDFYDGVLENVVAHIPGESKETVMIMAHLCHPKPSANDNASGCAGAIEVMVLLSYLIKQGYIDKPKRSIRMVLVPEMTGTSAYLASMPKNERKNIMAAVNLDMIGGRQGVDVGPVCIFRTPMASASFVNHLVELIMEEVLKDVQVFNEKISFFHFEMHSFVGGSDHQIINDSRIGIPCLSFTQWPDRFYHTNFDTPNRIDPNLINKSVTIAATWLFTLATLNEDHAAFILTKSAEVYSNNLGNCIRDWVPSNESLEVLNKRMIFHERNAVRSSRDLIRFFDKNKEIINLIKVEEKSYKILRQSAFERSMTITTKENKCNFEVPLDEKYNSIPLKLYMGNLNGSKVAEFMKQERFDELSKSSKNYGRSNPYILYWINGTRSIYQIYENTVFECGTGDLEYTYSYLCFLSEMGLIKFV